jgi:serine/threonine protein kinase
LLTHLQLAGQFTPKTTRFYACEILLALQFLHENNIIYRDLKLENSNLILILALLCGDGHIKIADYGMFVFYNI